MSGSHEEKSTPRVVICGGGIQGCSTAYYLSLRGVKPIVVERWKVACAASGKAGGFLARDWGSVTSLGATSFDLHAELAKDPAFADVGYRRVDTLSVTGTDSGRKQHSKKLGDWVDGKLSSVQTLGTTDTTAQVHPRLLSEALMSVAEANGAKLVIGEVVDVVLSDDQSVKSVKLGDGSQLDADVAVIAMGPWSDRARAWFPKLKRVAGQKAHSITMRPKAEIPAQALFTDLRYTKGTGEPEIYPRPDGEVYACGTTDGSALPDDPRDVAVTPGTCKDIQAQCGALCSCLAAENTPLEAEQACFLPSVRDHSGLPIIGAIPGATGAYVATGHTCWGILNAPVTGLALSQLIVDGHAKVVDLAPYSPAR